MSLPTTTITGKVYTPKGVVATGGSIRCTLTHSAIVNDESSSSSEVVAGFMTFGIQATGDVETGMKLVPNDAMTPAGTCYRAFFTVLTPVAYAWEELWYVASTPDPVEVGDIARINVAPGLSIPAPFAGMNAYFGDGSDGDYSVPGGGLVLSRDWYYRDLTVPVGTTVSTNGYRLFVSGTLTVAGLIYWVPINGGNASGAIGGGTTPNLTAANLGAGTGGRGGGNGSTSGDGSAGVNQGSPINGMGGLGGIGGYGGGVTGPDRVGGIGGTAGAYGYQPFRSLSVYLSRLAATLIQSGAGGAGGGGGASTGDGASGGGGGAGGTGGGVIAIFAKTIVVSATGKIQANGGNGGNGAAATLGEGTGSGGGGGGASGGGGFLYLVYGSLTNSGTIAAAAGTPGNGGAGVGTGANGHVGYAGWPGRVVKINLTTGVFE